MGQGHFEFYEKKVLRPMETIVFPTLFKLDTSGRTREWFMELQGDQYRSNSRMSGGAWTVSEWHKAYPKNVGRANATSAVEQAKAEVEAKYTHKLDRGFTKNEEQIKEASEVYIKPMLATKWQDRKDKVEFPIFVQPKLDGIRCIAKYDGLYTREGKRITSCKHIENALKLAFKDFPHLVFDGELYNHDFHDQFDKISGAVRREQPDMFQEMEIESIVQFHCYDIVASTAFSKRNANIRYLFENEYFPSNGVIRQVETFMCFDHDATDRYFGDWLEKNYEGQMIRLDKPYDHKRSNSLIKRKEFISEEFPVLRVEEGLGNWSGAVKRFILDLGNGIIGEAGTRGTREKLTELLSSGSIPDWATVRYFGKTPDGKLRFPVVTDYGFGKRED